MDHSDAPSPRALLPDDDPLFAARAQQRLAPKSRLSRLFSKPRPRTGDSSPRSSTESVPPPPSTADAPINLDNSALAGEDIYSDRYEWAVLYENQRGITVFSLPYYSSLSLLPTDPSPFTLPGAALKRSKQPPVSLDSYPLPDGTWHWVSRCWMIDMRSDTGEVQHDGFEYNWMFRRHSWRAQIGSFNAGGWVRRRRWVRLMVRPAKQKADALDGSLAPSSNINHRRSVLSLGSTLPPSVLTHGTGYSDWAHMLELAPDEVWAGDADADWQRCRALLRRFVRDGHKLELWKLWLGVYHPEHKHKFEPDPESRHDKQWTEDALPLPSELAAADRLTREHVALAPRAPVIAVLRAHAPDILALFVFPESRMQFLALLARAGMLAELNVGLDVGFGAGEVGFWSYASGLGGLEGAEDLALLKTPSSASLSSKRVSAPVLLASSPSMDSDKSSTLEPPPKSA